MMVLVTDRSKPELTAAEARANTKLDWDLTITLPLNNAAIRTLPKAKSVTLMTSGWTGLAELGQGDRELIAGFLKSCATKA